MVRDLDVVRDMDVVPIDFDAQPHHTNYCPKKCDPFFSFLQAGNTIQIAVGPGNGQGPGYRHGPGCGRGDFSSE